jgi:hypothetical protein
MTVPEPLYRFPTAQAIASLAARFDLPIESWMQDWEWEVADSNKIDEYIAAYKNGGLTDDERFTLMEMIIHAFEDTGESINNDSRWVDTLQILEQNIELHAYSVWYWSDLENELEDQVWYVTPFFRRIVDRVKHQLDPSFKF